MYSSNHAAEVLFQIQDLHKKYEINKTDRETEIALLQLKLKWMKKLASYCSSTRV